MSRTPEPSCTRILRRRRIIRQRTKDALALKRAQGVRLGRPSTLPPEIVARIVK